MLCSKSSSKTSIYNYIRKYQMVSESNLFYSKSGVVGGCAGGAIYLVTEVYPLISMPTVNDNNEIVYQPIQTILFSILMGAVGCIGGGAAGGVVGLAVDLFHPQQTQQICLNKIYDQQVSYLPYNGGPGVQKIGSLIVSHEGSSSIETYLGQNYIKADGLFFISLGSGIISFGHSIYFDPFKNKIKENRVCVIEKFNPSNDKILLSSASVEEVIIKQTIISGDDYTCLEVKEAALCLSGDISLTADNIIMV
jgi:hypothetical protein